MSVALIQTFGPVPAFWSPDVPAAAVPLVEELRVMSEPIVSDRAMLMIRLSGEADELLLDYLDPGFSTLRRVSLKRLFQAGWNVANFDASELPNGACVLSVRARMKGMESPARLGKSSVLR